MMHVPVDDEHAGQPVFFLRVAGRDGHVVEQAKTHRPGGFSMVAGGRTAQNACSTSPRMIASTAASAPPAAKYAAGSEPGDIEVSIECDLPLAWLVLFNAATYEGLWICVIHSSSAFRGSIS